MITSALANSFKLEVLQGVHQPGDDYRIALFTGAANLDENTSVYDGVGEAAGIGYAAGGQSLAGIAFALTGSVAHLNWTTDPAWPASTITARGAQVYNATRGNKAVACFDFGVDKSSSAGEFKVHMPASGPATSLVRYR